MPHPSPPLGELDARLNSPLIFIPCGSAGEGKSMLLCQLLHAKPVFNDRLTGIGLKGKTSGTIGGEIDLVSPFEGYEARCEKGLTDDVPYRHLEIKERTFLAAETRGREKFTRELVIAASTAKLTGVLVDSRQGILKQTRRHSYISSQLGIRHFLLPVDKIDIIDFLEPIEVATPLEQKAFSFLVQVFTRPVSDHCGYAGEVASGRIAVGDQIAVAESRQCSTIKAILAHGAKLESATAGQSVKLIFADNVGASPTSQLLIVVQFQAQVIWFDEPPMLPGRSHILRAWTDDTPTTLKHRLCFTNLSRETTTSLHPNEVGVCNVSKQAPIALNAFSDNRTTGNFIIIDRRTNATVSAGTNDFTLQRADNVHWQAIDVNKQARSAMKRQRPSVLWFTGLSGSGKSTIANALDKLLYARGKHTYLLDGDNVRHGLNHDLGFTEVDRVENIRRVAEVAKLMADAGLIVIVSLISPFRHERRMAREMMDEGEFIEVFVDTPLEECARRDPKGLYEKALTGKIANFTGVSSPYEVPENPDLHLKTVGTGAAVLARRIVEFLERRLDA